MLSWVALQQACPGMILIAICPSDIGPHSARIDMTRHVHNPVEVGATIGRRGDEAGAQRVTTETCYIEAGQFGMALHDVRDGVAGDGIVRNLAAARHGPEDRTMRYACSGHPGLERLHRHKVVTMGSCHCFAQPLLISLAAAHKYVDSRFAERQVFDIERCQLASSECASEAEQSIARSGWPAMVRGTCATMVNMRSAVAGSFWTGATPTSRLMPRMTFWTASASVGDGKPAVLWAQRIAAAFCAIDDTLCPASASAERKSTTVVTSAGTVSRPCAWHHTSNDRNAEP